MRRLQKCAVGVLIVAALSVSPSGFASPLDSDHSRDDSFLTRLRTWIVRAFDYNGVSLPPG